MSLVLLKTHGNRRSKLFYRGNDKIYLQLCNKAVEKEIGRRVRVGHISGKPCMPILNKNNKRDVKPYKKYVFRIKT